MKFREAIRQATAEAMEANPKVLLIGVGITDTSANVYGTITGLYEQYGPQRVIEGPLSENALTGITLGLALDGYRPILIHHRIDFALLSMDQIVNHVAKWRSMFGQAVPLVIRGIVGRGWGNGAQHTQSLHSTFAHIPGLRVVVPASPQDAYELLLASIAGQEPVIFIEHRWLHESDGWPTPGPSSKPAVTVVAIGPLVPEAIRASQAVPFEVEVIDPHCIAPLNMAPILSSLERTGRLVVADPDWAPCGIASEIITQAVEAGALKAPPRRVCWPGHYVGSARRLEDEFYPGAAQIQDAIELVTQSGGGQRVTNTDRDFRGPF